MLTRRDTPKEIVAKQHITSFFTRSNWASQAILIGGCVAEKTPSAGVGALLMLMMFGFDFTIIALIGVILLIGIVKKNGIKMVDFAIVGQRERGLSAPVIYLYLDRFGRWLANRSRARASLRRDTSKAASEHRFAD